MAKFVSLILIVCLQALAQPAPAPSETDQLIASLRAQVEKAPTEYTGYDALGAAFLQKARETGAAEYYDLAEKNASKAISLAPPGFKQADPLVHLAMVYMGEHRFTEALATAQKAIGLGAGNLPAFAIEGDAYTDMGEYDDAADAYHAAKSLGETVTSATKLSYMLDSRLAYLAFLHGENEESIRLMQAAIQSATRLHTPRENLAWLYYELGERYFQTGDIENSALSYSTGIGIDANHYRCLAGLAKVRAAQGRLDEAIKLYRKSIAVVPFPVYVAELGDVFEKAGRSKEAHEQYDLVEFIGHLSKLSQVLANRELAMFYADRQIKLPEAVDLARHELDVRHDVYTWDTLAWVLYRNGKFQEAADAMHKALALHTKDPLFLFHAGMIAHAQGRDAEAEDLLRQAVKINPHFHLLYASVAGNTLEALARKHHPVVTAGAQ